jgi:hypothetical protein
MLLSSYDVDHLTICLVLAELQALQRLNLLAIYLVITLSPSLVAGRPGD